MPKSNPLTDTEIALIKSLLEKKYKNQEIVGMINRSRGDASKDINSGRVSEIKSKKNQKLLKIEPATNDITDKFISNYNLIDKSIDDKSDPLSPPILSKLLPLSETQKDQLSITETDQIECKRSYNIEMKTIAAFANNKGGYLVLGVEDNTWRIVGIDETKIRKFDFNQINQSIRSELGISIDIKREILTFGTKKVVVFYIGEAHTKPVIITKSKGGTAEGHIYFRYPGENRLISPLDLNKIIEDRVKNYPN